MSALETIALAVVRFALAFVWCAALFAGVVYLTGCNSLPPPGAINVKSDAPEVLAKSIALARDAWCAADVGWCPDLVTYGGADVVITTWAKDGHFAGPGETLEEAGWTGPAAHTSAWRVEVDPNFATDLDLPWVLVHEFGHFCINDFSPKSKLIVDAHVPTSAIMQAAQLDGRPDAVVDEPARRAWLDSCGD